MALCIAVRVVGGGCGGVSWRFSPLHLLARRSSRFRPPQQTIQCSRQNNLPPFCYRRTSSATSTIDVAVVNNSPISFNDSTSPEKQNTHQPTRHLSVAIVGAGPSGFYTAKYLTSAVLKKIQSTAAIASGSPSAAVVGGVATDDDDGGGAAGLNTQMQSMYPSSTTNFNYCGIDIDILERLPTPYGLVRYGVAPDHPEVKNVEKEFASLFEEHDYSSTTTSSSIAKKLIADGSPHPHQTTFPTSSLAYFGNVDVGRTISLSQLQNLYDIVILAYGCQASDKRLGIPGEAELEGVLSAREFVAWYNGHPEFGHIGRVVHRCLWPSSLSGEEGGVTDGKDSSSSSNDDNAISKARVVVIGQGNVALDVARILSKGKPGLMGTDTPTSVLDVLRGGVSHVSIVGRRGHVQGAFTIKEIRELTKLHEEGHDVAFHVRKEEIELGMTESSASELKGSAGRPKIRLVKLLQEAAESTSDKSAAKQVELRFLMNPIRFESDNSVVGRVGQVVCERTKLVGDPFHQQPIGTNETEVIPANLVLVSIGYRGMPLEGMKELQIFDEKKGAVVNNQGKVVGENNLFVTGWIKRGPFGIIGTNIVDAKETVASIIKFIESGELNAQQPKVPDISTGRVGLTEYLGREGVESIGWSQFLKIDAAECNRTRLRTNDQPREKIISIEEMLSVVL